MINSRNLIYTNILDLTDKAKQELKELKDKQDATKED